MHISLLFLDIPLFEGETLALSITFHPLQRLLYYLSEKDTIHPI